MNPRNYAVIYHHWGKLDCRTLECPILLSIASLRARTPAIPIYVLDCASRKVNWGHYPSLLDFQVVKRPLTLPPRLFRGRVLWGTCSRVFDVEAFAQTIEQPNIINTDSDIFFLRDILPLSRHDALDRFCCRPENTGYYYFDKTSPRVRAFYDLWKRVLREAIEDHDVRKRVWASCGVADSRRNIIHEEMVYFHVKSDELTCEIPMCENRRLKRGLSSAELAEARNLHIMRVFWKRNKGLVPLLIRETRASLSATLGEAGLRELFGREYRRDAEFSLAELADERAYRSLEILVMGGGTDERFAPHV